MFKKSLAAVAVLGAFAGSALAAEVSLYGIVDYGMLYQHQEMDLSVSDEFDDYAFSDSNDVFGLDSGVNSASRFGLKGSEDIGNGYTVSFKLENGFNADDGQLGKKGRLFDREASLTIANDDTFGALSFGRMGGIGSSAGTYDTLFAIGDAFDGGDNAIYTGVMTSRYDNMITYQSPKFAGLQATAQYSLKMDNDKKSFWGEGEEGHNTAQRYAAFALTGEYGALQAVASYEQIMLSTNAPSDSPVEWDDAQIVSLGANYDFGLVKPFIMAQYFEHAPLTVLGEDEIDSMPIFAEGYSLHLGAQAPVMGGNLTAGIYYSDADDSYVDLLNIKTIAASVKYEYPLSNRTSLYGSIGYGSSEIDGSVLMAAYTPDSADLDLDLDVTQAYIGITHTF